MATRLVFSLGADEVARLSWPPTLETEARAFIRDNLFAERVRAPHLTEALLARGAVTPEERETFLADRPCVLPEPPEALAAALDLDDLVAEFSVALEALRFAAPSLSLTWRWEG